MTRSGGPSQARVAPRDLKRHMAAGHAVVSGWCMLPGAVTAELVAAQPFDAVTIDLQHGLIDYQAALSMLQAIDRFDVAPLVRVPWNEPGIIGKTLDAGFMGVICPMVNTRDDAQRLVDACHYAPHGRRSYGPTRARRRHGADYGASARDIVVTLAMIETAEALANLDAILAVDGIDGVYIGPADLALSLGHAPTLLSDEPEVVAAIASIGSRTRAAGKVAGIHAGDAASTRRLLDQGFGFVALGTDISLFERAMARELASVRALETTTTPRSTPAGQY